MNSTTDVQGALRDLLRFHFGPNARLLALLAVVAAGALAVLLGGILFGGIPGPGYVPPAFRRGLAYRAVGCWAVSTICAYAGGFVMGRLYVSQEPVMPQFSRGG
jgi:hypothetical protein